MIEIVTSFEVIIENFWPKFRKNEMLPEIENRGQHFTNWGGKFSVMIDTPVTICFVIPQNQTILPVNI